MKHIFKFLSILLLVILSRTAFAAYCTPTYSTGCTYGDGLTLFQLGAINQTVPCSGTPAWYHDYTTGTQAAMTIGVPITLTIATGYSGTYCNVYIDYNQNQVFDAGELVGQRIDGGTITITVPGTALTGVTRLRILTEWYSYPSGPCTAQTYGNCCDFPVNIAGAYCTPVYSSGCGAGDGLTNFQLNTINQAIPCSGSPSYYHDYTTSSTTLTEGNTYVLTVIAGYSATHVRVWIDLNNNNTFDQPGEIMVSDLICTSAATPYTANIVIPCGTSTGNHRLRYRTSWGSAVTDPCTSITYGNAADFTINAV
ncbi:MAG TPA: GEVED domain-containing protein, partial [Bacteroidales bacterium]|nr:GEVED domain-containing protein [Bacteroidales bacterium]